MIKKIVNHKIFHGKPTQTVTAAAIIISLSGVASRALGIIRDRILASQFGAGDVLDVYYAAFRIPDLLYNLLILGALSAAFIPVFTHLISDEKEEDGWKMASGVLTLQMLVMGLVSVILIVGAPIVMRAITPGFNEQKLDAVVVFTRIMFLSPILLGISAIFGGILVSFKKFLIYSLAPIFYNVGIIIGAVFFTRFMGPIGLAWGVVLGAFMHMLIQYPAVKVSGFKYLFSLKKSYQNKDVRKVMHLMLPRTMSIAVTQINFLVITIFASTLAAGSLAVFNLANNIQSAPLGLFGVAYAIAVFPTLSALAAKKSNEEFVKLFDKTARQILFFVIPSSVFIFVLRAQIVRVLLGSGKFDWNDTVLTLQTLGILAISLFAQAIIPLLTRSFYACHDSKTPFYIAVISEMVNIVLVVAGIRYLGLYGLAVAFSISNVVNMLLLNYKLRQRFPQILGKDLRRAVVKIAFASIVAGLFAQATKYVVGSNGELDTLFKVITQLVVAGFTGIAIFSLAAVFLEIEEYHAFVNSISRKIFKAKKEIQEDTGEVAGI